MHLDVLLEDRANAWRSAIIGLMALVLFFHALGDTSLPSLDDAYHAQTAKEMLHRLDPIGISYGGHFSFESSPLPNWLTAISYLIFGINEYAARFPVALLSVLGIFFVFRFARKRWGAEEATAAAFILCTTYLYLRYGRHVMAEIPVTFFITLAILAFVEGHEEKRFVRFGIYSGLAILCKSALGFLPLIIGALALIVFGRGRELFSRKFLAGIGAAVAVAAVWYVPALLIYGQRFIESHIGAYLAVHTLHGHHADLGWIGLFFYFFWLPIQYLPWTLPLIPALARSLSLRRSDSSLAVFWLAVVTPVILLSFITSKYTRYLMPIFPAAALLLVGYWRQRLKPETKENIANYMAGFAALVALAVIIFPISLGEDRNDEVRSLAPTIIEKAGDRGEIVDFRLSYFYFQNPLLFYTDLRLTPEVGKAEEVFDGLRFGATRYGLTDSEGMSLLRKGLPPGVSLETVARSGDIRFFCASLPSPDVILDELKSFGPLIPLVEPSEFIATYKMPHSDIYQFMRKVYGRRIMPDADQWHRLVRSMLSRGTHTGICSRSVEADLLKPREDEVRFTILARTPTLSLFHIDATR